MKSVAGLLGLCAVALSLSSCATKSGGGSEISATGPFDSRGNYVEEWADTPSKWGKKGVFSSSRNASPTAEDTPDIPKIATNEQPPENSVPISSGPVEVASKSKTAKSRTADKNSERDAIKRKTEVVTTSKTKSKETTTKAKETASVKVKPKVTVEKTVAKKPSSTRYVIKKGDSLSAIASRNGTTVGALQRANGISGSMIQPGKTLVIPKKK